MTKRILRSLFAPGLLLAVTACGFGSGDPADNAEAAFEARDYYTARIEAGRALEDAPSDQRMLFINARTLIELGDGVSAQYAISKIDDDGEYGTQKPLLMAEAKLAAREFEEALALAQPLRGPGAARVTIIALTALDRAADGKAKLAEALAAHPENARLLALSGALALSEARVVAAKDLASRALNADPQSLDALMLAGQLRVLRQDYDGASELYTKAVTANPSSIAALFALAAVEADRGETERARELLANVLSRASGHPLAILLDAKLDFLGGDLDAARDKLRENERTLSQIPEGRLLLAEVSHLDGLHNQAVVHLNAFLRTNPGHAHASTLLAQSLDGIGDTAGALAAIRPVADRASASPQALALASRLTRAAGGSDPYAERGQVERDGEYVKALTTADRALASGKNKVAIREYEALRKRGGAADALVLNNSAVAYDRVGRSGDALAMARAAYALTPGDPQVKDTLGWAMLRAGGDRGRALALIQSASEALPGNLQIRWHLANALAENGRRGEAKRLIAGIREFVGPAQQAEFDKLLARL